MQQSQNIQRSLHHEYIKTKTVRLYLTTYLLGDLLALSLPFLVTVLGNIDASLVVYRLTFLQ